jgi:integrase
MARLFRQPYTKPIPPDAERCTLKGKPAVRFADDGRTVTAPLTKKGDRIRLLSAKWYGEYIDADDMTRRVPLSADKTAAQQMLAELVRKAELGKAGIRDPFEAHHKRPLVEHVEDYRRYLAAEGNTADYVAQTCSRIRAVTDGCGFAFIADITPEKVTEFLHGLRRDPRRPALPPGQESFTPRELIAALGGVRPPRLARLLRREGLAVTGGDGKARRYPRATVEALQGHCLRGIGVCTSNHYLTAVKGFTRWLATTASRTDRDRLASLSRLNAATDLRHERRALPEAELRALLAAAGTSPAEFLGLAGPDRAMLYAVAMVSGFRAGELASLAPGSFALDADPPTATVKAAYSKNRRTSVQPLPPDVALALRGYLDGRPAGAAVWSGAWHKDAAEMLRLDLAAAAIPYRDAEGRVADFHALRHSYITLLERSGVSPKLAQELARHSDIRLTLNVYTHARLYDLAGAVEGLPALLPGAPTTEATALKATGTDGKSPTKVVSSLPSAYRKGDSPCGAVRADDGTGGGGTAGSATPQVLKLDGVESGCQSMRAAERKLPGQDSNLDKGNQNPIRAERFIRSGNDLRRCRGARHRA